MKQNWERKKLGEVCEFRNGAAHEQDINEDGKYILVNSKFISADGEKLKRTNKALSPLYVNEIVFVMSDVPNGKALAKCFLVDKDNTYTLNQRIGAIKSNVFIPEFLTYQLNRNKYLLSFDNGENQTNLRKNDILNCPLLIPPLPAQQRIVAILDKAFSAISKAKSIAEQNLINVKELFENYLQRVFENKGEGWKENTLGELSTFRNGMNFTKTSKGEQIKIVGVRDFKNNFWIPFKELESVIIDNNLNEIDQLQENDIIAVRSNGNPELIGRTLLASKVEGKVSHSGFTIRIRLHPEILSAVYLCQYLKTQKTRKKLVDSGNGVGIRSLNQVSLSSLSISYPNSKKEQESIVHTLDTLSAETKKLEAIYKKKIDNLEELKKSIFQKAINGELHTIREITV